MLLRLNLPNLPNVTNSRLTSSFPTEMCVQAGKEGVGGLLGVLVQGQHYHPVNNLDILSCSIWRSVIGCSWQLMGASIQLATCWLETKAPKNIETKVASQRRTYMIRNFSILYCVKIKIAQVCSSSKSSFQNKTNGIHKNRYRCKYKYKYKLQIQRCVCAKQQELIPILSAPSLISPNTHFTQFLHLFLLRRWHFLDNFSHNSKLNLQLFSLPGHLLQDLIKSKQKNDYSSCWNSRTRSVGIHLH